MTKSNYIKVAQEFLATNLLTDSLKWTSLNLVEDENLMNTFWWNNKIQLLDIPLFNQVTKELCGYLLVSENLELPPVIEYATEGISLKRQIDSLLIPSLYSSQIDLQIGKYYFYSSTEIYVELLDKSENGSRLIRIPDLVSIDNNIMTAFSRLPSDVFDKDVVLQLWESKTPNPPGDKPELVLNNARPVKYQQNCDSYNIAEMCKIDLLENNSYCAPRRISGCVPVAWAMLLSAWKRTGFWDSSNIWKTSTCWDIDWPSWGSIMNPSQCELVQSSIWKLHRIMNTTAGGSTFNNVIINGRQIFGDFSMPWKFHRVENRNFEFACQIISAGQPFLFDGQGQWSGPEKAGHGVVAYGYKKANRTILVSLGWGTSFPDKYINHDQYASRGYTYLTGTKSINRDSDEILEL